MRTNPKTESPKGNNIGKKLIESAINMDNVLADILKIEIKNARRMLRKDVDPIDLGKLLLVLKNVILALTLTEERIRDGMDLYNADDKKDQQDNA